jgi:uncharacterized protein YdaU (DUF1376 family)
MHYYQFNIGDYHTHTDHLSEMEDLAYRRMLDWCYLHEKELPLDCEQIARLIRMRSHTDCIAIVIEEFFVQHDGGWISERVLEEIEHYRAKIEQASKAGKASAERRLNGSSTGVQLTNNYKPITNNQELFNADADASLSADDLPSCPHQEILLLYKKNLPHLLQPRVWEGNRQRLLKTRWVQASLPSNYSPEGYKTKQAGLKWWDSFFAYIANDSSLANGFKSKERTWLPDLEWIVTASNFSKIIDGKYAK